MTLYFDFSGFEITQFKGRPKPIKPSRYGGNPEFTRLTRPKAFQSYPNKLVKDKEKFYYLKDLLKYNAIQPEVFVDLAGMLSSIRKKLIDEAINNVRY